MTRFGTLLGHRMRRDAVQVTLWIVGTAVLAYASFVGVGQSYGTENDRRALLAAALANPVILLFRGLPSGTDPGAFMVFLILPWLALLAALMSTFLAVRHTRGDEEAGRTELVAATPAGRFLPLIATIAHGIIANAVLAILVALAYAAVGLDLAGAALTGAATGAVGVGFLGVGLVAAQLVRTSRGANSLAVWLVVATFVIAGLGNAIGTPSDDLTRMESSWLAWVSPFAWAENARPFDDNAWWPVALCLALATVLVVAAVALSAVRDVGESLIAQRAGRTTAPASLSSPAGLVWRLTRGALAGWAVGGFLTGVLSTSLASVVRDIGAANPAVERILQQLSGDTDVARGAITAFFTMLGLLAACAAVQIVCRARQEEAHGTAEPVLAAPVDRVRWFTGYLLWAFAGVLVVIGAGIAGAAVGIVARNGDWDLMRSVLVDGAGQVAAASVFLVLTALAFVLAPRATIVVGWLLVLLGIVLGLFGPLFGMPHELVRISPFAATPQLRGDEFDAVGLWWLVLAVAVGATLSLVLMRRREVTSS